MDTQHSIITEEQLNGVVFQIDVIGGQVQKHETISGVVGENQQHQIGIVHIKENIEGIIQQTNALNGVIKNNDHIEGTINYHTEGGGSEVPTYEGAYTVTPKIHEQSLATKNKRMKADVTIKEIPYYETSNISGKTVYIGGE